MILNTALACAGLLLALIIGEGVARLVHPTSTVEYRIDSEVGQILVPDQVARWVSPDFDVKIVTNSAGFHDVEHLVDKSKDVYRVVVVGDSYIEALQVPIEESFTQQLERMLQRNISGKRVEVINLGIGGTGPAQYYRRLEIRGLRYKPDVVLMAVHPDNDFWDSYHDLSGAVTKPFYSIGVGGALEYIPPQPARLSVRVASLVRRSAFWLLLRKGIADTAIEKWLSHMGLLTAPGATSQFSQNAVIPIGWYVYVADRPEPWPDAYRVTLRMIKESKDLTEREGARFLVMLVGSVPMVEGRWNEALSKYPRAKTLTFDFESPFKAIESLGRDSGFDVINLVEPFRKDFLVSRTSRAWPHDGHWTQRGHQLAAEIVSAHMLERRVLFKFDGK